MRFALVLVLAAACGSVSTSKPDARVDSAPVSCPALQDPAHGTVTSSGTDPGATATYACGTGYDPSGPTMRTCQPDGTWSGNAPLCQACTSTTTPQLTAIANQSVNYDANDTPNNQYNDNLTRAYSNPGGSCSATGVAGCDITGWFEFDLSSLPANAQITQIKLGAWLSTNQTGPQVRVQYSNINNWTRATPFAMFARTTPEVAAPRDLTGVAPATYQEWAIDGTMHDFSADVADKSLTLGLDNANTAYSYAYFDGTDAGSHLAYITVSYCH